MVKTQNILLLEFFFIGMISGFFAIRNLPEPVWWTLLSTVLISVTIFYWYRLDSTKKEFKRPFLMSVGVVAIAPVVIPLYVLGSTQRGRRLAAFGRLLGYVCLLIITCMIGGAIGAAIG